ncbi:FMN-binding negative transcriptional regulator [Caulobacter segnis]|uniref:FMN-binding negative transcriptional regulator n=1 Tax=Caulobacter segnis TaxID=88688 RepID=UPI002860EDD3|nr:FMN-binding negative transcriptional regulator [Caulobacter segnis]MDR6625860.1 transcriptional regulator [Caulobacter segnis]
MSHTFSTWTDDDVADLIAAYPLAWMVSGGAIGFQATPLPLLADLDGEGRLVSLTGHLARSNPQVEALERDANALALFMGPHGYVSPSWMSDRTQAPTWNYAVLRIEVRVRLGAVTVAESLDRLSRAMEANRPKSWSPGEMGERYGRLSRGVVAFRADVTRLDGRFKLGQDERDDVYADIMAGLVPGKLTDWMRRFNPDR